MLYFCHETVRAFFYIPFLYSLDKIFINRNTCSAVAFKFLKASSVSIASSVYLLIPLSLAYTLQQTQTASVSPTLPGPHPAHLQPKWTGSFEG